MNRRNFIGKTSILASLNFLGLKAVQASVGNNAEGNLDDEVEKNDIIYRTLGRTGIKVPVVSMGVMNASIPGLVVKSYEKGVRLFDTAWYYQRGMNEKMVGETIERLGVRDKVILVTKIYLRDVERDTSKPETKDLFLERFEESLSRLRTDYVDILLYHAIRDIEELHNPHILEALTELKEAGKIKHAAVSLHGDSADMLDIIVTKKFYDVAMVKFNIAYADDPRTIKSIENAANEGVGIIAMKTQCGGGGKMWWKEHEDSRETLGDLNQKAMLKWVMQHEYIATAIPGYTTYEQLDENFSVASDLVYSEEEKNFLDRAQVKLAQSFCVDCKQCMPSCPNKVDIPELMRTYMYAYQYQNMEHALATEKTIPSHAGLSQCQLCDSCTAECKRSLNLANRIEALKELNFA